MGEIQSNYEMARAQTASGTEAQSIGGDYSLNDARAIRDILEGKQVPFPMEASSDDLPKGHFEQDDTAKPINNDIDGDGIPDDYDKNEGRSVADVAAQMHKIGKYAENDKNTSEIFASSKSSKNIRNAVIGLLDKVSESSAQSLGKAGTKEANNHNDDPFRLKKLDSMDKNS